MNPTPRQKNQFTSDNGCSKSMKFNRFGTKSGLRNMFTIGQKASDNIKYKNKLIYLIYFKYQVSLNFNKKINYIRRKNKLISKR